MLLRIEPMIGPSLLIFYWQSAILQIVFPLSKSMYNGSIGFMCWC